MEDGMDIEEHDLLNNPTVRSVFPDLAVLKQEIIDFDTSEGVAPETFTTQEVPKRNENKNNLHNLTVYSGDHPTECSTKDLDVKPDHLCTDMDVTITVKGNSLTKFHEVDTEIKKESENVVANELPFYRNRIILGKIHVDESDEEREIDAPGDCNNVVNNKTNNDQDLAVSIYTDENRSMRITKQYYEMEKCLGAKIIVTNCYTTLLNNNCYCAQCAVLFPTTEAYSEHYTSTHTETTTSTKASASLVIRKNMIHPRERKFVCDTCEKTFSKKSSLIEHIMLIHTGHKPFECRICTKTFRHRNCLINHKFSLSGKKPFQCNICTKIFKQTSHLKRHMLLHTGEKPFECEICKNLFSHSFTLKRHMLLHTGEKPFQCETCKKTFRNIWNLKQHKLLHTGEKFQCDICKKTFRHKSTIKTHMLIHTGEKPFECDICTKSFYRISNLKSHKLIHTGEKPFECETCKKTFRQRTHLKNHKLIHTGEKPFQCDICTKSFNHINTLKRHKLLLHSHMILMRRKK
ncbi:zinc finger protein 724 isoform X4 [Plutella xylostella]|uniref:zinc finger protein 724 isoform X3 n=1 Tax=Plutella xylostella TaxID=51655 RepID=UPI002032F3BE|nr:zinc finger protein 724 isoform X3 [Plutella xylostella]XP_048479913.1 zinc finger protein 724 isoform X4 [Plutella xylostella]